MGPVVWSFLVPTLITCILIACLALEKVSVTFKLCFLRWRAFVHRRTPKRGEEIEMQ